MSSGTSRSACAALILAALACGEAPAPEPDVSAAISFSGDVAADLVLVEDAVAEGPFRPDWDSLAENGVPDWYRDAKLGIFIHWGVYSVPSFGNEWYPRRMYLQEGEGDKNLFEYHKKTFGPQKEFGYKDFIPMFQAENFDPEAWAALFEESGARYIVPVAEHHDGFSMYANSYTEWDSTEMGPKRDIVAELGDAVRARGMKLGVSSHRAFNYGYFARDESYDTVDPANFGLYGADRPDLHFTSGRNFDWFPQSREFMDDWMARTAELVEKTQADLIWFDFGIGPPSEVTDWKGNPLAEDLQRFMAFYYNRAKAWGKTGVVNYKLDAMPEKAAVLDLERARLSGMRDQFWQTDTSVSFSSWGYVSNHRYKEVGMIVTNFVDIVSKNGCLLLNIGPRPDGTIPDEEAEMLRSIGRWLKTNGEAIYGSRPWKIYGEGPTETVEGHLSEQRNKPMGAEDFRYTVQGDQLYVTALGLADEYRIKTAGASSEHLDGEITGVELLGYDGEIEWRQDDDALVIQSPGPNVGEYAYVFKLSF